MPIPFTDSARQQIDFFDRQHEQRQLGRRRVRVAERELAMVYDFDGTMIDAESVNPILDDLDLNKRKFWKECDDYAYEHNIDSICSYMLKLFEKAEDARLDLSHEYLESIGARQKLRPGLDDWWFDKVNSLGREADVYVSHYIVSSGIVDIVESVPAVKKYFRKVFGSRIHHLPNGGMFPGRVVNYTNKTQYLFRISKGQLDEKDEFAPNRKVDDRPVPFSNMVFIGDGFTDVPCFALMREYGGHSMAVLGSKPNRYQLVETLVADDRVDYVSLRDHFTSEGCLIQNFKRILAKVAKNGH